MSARIEKIIQTHAEEDVINFGALRDANAKIMTKLEKIEGNDLYHLHLSTIQLETDAKWLKWGIMLIIGCIVGLYFQK